MSVNKPKVSLSSRRLRFYRLLAVMFPILLLATAEGMLRLLMPNIAKDPYLTFSPIASFLTRTQLNGRDYYEVSHPEYYKSRNTLFPVDKPEGGLRVFCLGGSASAGWPLPPNQTWSHRLELALEAAYPGRPIEILNISMHAYPSFRVRMIFNEIVDLEPDLIILYSGNNEYLENRSYAGRVRQKFSQISWFENFRIVNLMRGWIDELRGHSVLSGKGLMAEHVSDWHIVKQRAAKLRSNPQENKMVQEHYAYNIDQIAQTCNRLGVPLLLLTVPSNLRDWEPNVSHNPLKGDELVHWRNLFDDGRRALLRNNAESAREAFLEAAAHNPKHAETHFWLARSFERIGQYEEALDHYVMARDLDYTPLRALSVFNNTIRSIARRYEGVYLVDMVEHFQKASPHGLVGFKFFMDHVHPTIDGHQLLAREVYSAVLQAKLFAFPAKPVALDGIPPPLGPDGRPYDQEQDLMAQMTILWVMGLLHQEEAILEKVKLSRKLYEAGHRAPDADKREFMPLDISFIEGVEQAVGSYIEMRHRELIGEPILYSERTQILNQYREFYQDYYLPPGEKLD